jgi:hypothetical protein
MSEQPVPYIISDKGSLEAARHRVAILDSQTADLWNYVRHIDHPDDTEWRLIVAQIWDMVNSHGTGNPYR